MGSEEDMKEAEEVCEEGGRRKERKSEGWKVKKKCRKLRRYVRENEERKEGESEG